MVDKTDQDDVEGEGKDATQGAKTASYGKPPQHTQWKKGVSGNPKGRPKGARNLRTVVADVARSRVSVNVNGTSKNMSALEAQVHMTKLRGLQGKGQSEARMLELYVAYLPEPEETATPPLSADELSVLENYSSIRALIDNAESEPEEKPVSVSAAAPKQSAVNKPAAVAAPPPPSKRFRTGP